MMKILIVADPISQLKPKADSTLAILREALKRRHKIFWALDTDIEYFGDHVRAKLAQVTGCEIDSIPTLNPAQILKLDSFDAVFIRKDPPFDVNYVRLCWILSLIEKKVWCFNPPSVLVRYHEKLIPLEAYSDGFLKKKDIIPTHLGSAEGALDFIRQRKLERVVQKPFLGYGGTGVRLVSVGDLTQRGEREVIQPYQAAVSKGDSRVFYLNGKLVGHFTRHPAPGDFISNLAHGGRAEKSKLNTAQFAVLARLGKFLKKAGIYFAGADLIGTCISEVNITSPTGIRSLESLEGFDLSVQIMDFVERKVK